MPDITWTHAGETLNEWLDRIQGLGWRNPVDSPGSSGAAFVSGALGDPDFLYTLGKNAEEMAGTGTATGSLSTLLEVSHPDDAADGRFFTFLSNPASYIEVQGFSPSTVANPAPIETPVTDPHPAFGPRDGAPLAFGHGGYLVAGYGDGDPNARDIDILPGKALDVSCDDFSTSAALAAITGTHASETLNGTGSHDTLQGLGGSDQINGLGAPIRSRAATGPTRFGEATATTPFTATALPT